MTHPTPWCLTYRYPLPPGATRPRPPEAPPARRPLGFRAATTRPMGDAARSPLLHLFILAALVHIYAERLFDLLP